MKAHLITIGDEILLGQTLNTNAAHIGKILFDLEIEVVKTSVVGDEMDDILNEFRETWERNDLVVVTGGLGPTHDDLTRECVVKFFDTTLVKDDNVLSDIKELFGKKGREVTPVNEDQAMVPKIAKVIRNQRGTAPGYWIEKDNKFFVVMPGVPFEMALMMDNYVVPNLLKKMPKPEGFTIRKTLLTTGIPESTLFERLGNINELLNGEKLAFLPSQFGVKLRITAHGIDETEAREKLTVIEQKIRSKAGRYIYGNEEDSLEKIIAKILKERELKISIAESCTGGLISHMITNVSGSSGFFERGIISYSNASKVELLNVPEDVLHTYGAVSLETAKEMARGVKAISGCDIGVAITGIMGPTGATAGKPVGLVYIGLCDDKVCYGKKYTFGDDRILNKERSAQAALEFLRRHLLGISSDE
jgi:nicotinamide-nucleotide amidase